MNACTLTMTRARRVAQLALSSLVLMTGCPADDDDTDTDATSNPSTMTMATNPTAATDATDATDATTQPTTGGEETGDTTTGGVEPVNYALDIQPIWDLKCVAGCHTAGGAATAGPLLNDGASHAALVDKQSPTVAMLLVAPGDPDGSYLWHKVAGTQNDVPNGGGARMPIGPALSDDELDLIERWIAEGANP